MTRHQILLVAHAPSPNTRRMVDAVLEGGRHPDVSNVDIRHVPPLSATPDDVLAAHGLILGTPENLGYMSGALKDFFDRIYYPCLEHTHGRPFAYFIRAGNDGAGTQRAIATITRGLKWRSVRDPVVCRGSWRDDFLEECRELGLFMAAGLDAGLW